MWYGCVSAIFLLVIGVFGAVEEEYFVWARPVIALDGGGELDIVVEERESYYLRRAIGKKEFLG